MNIVIMSLKIRDTSFVFIQRTIPVYRKSVC